MQLKKTAGDAAGDVRSLKTDLVVFVADISLLDAYVRLQAKKGLKITKLQADITAAESSISSIKSQVN